MPCFALPNPEDLLLWPAAHVSSCELHARAYEGSQTPPPHSPSVSSNSNTSRCASSMPLWGCRGSSAWSRLVSEEQWHAAWIPTPPAHILQCSPSAQIGMQVVGSAHHHAPPPSEGLLLAPNHIRDPPGLCLKVDAPLIPLDLLGRILKPPLHHVYLPINSACCILFFGCYLPQCSAGPRALQRPHSPQQSSSQSSQCNETSVRPRGKGKRHRLQGVLRGPETVAT